MDYIQYTLSVNQQWNKAIVRFCEYLEWNKVDINNVTYMVTESTDPVLAPFLNSTMFHDPMYQGYRNAKALWLIQESKN